MMGPWRIALQYVLLFGANGVTLPFAGLWLRGQGLSGAEIGLLLAAPMLGRMVTGPALAVWADRFSLRRTPIALLGLAMAAGYGGAALVEWLPMRGALWCVGATAAAALIPLTDVFNLRLAERQGFAFSRPRAFGSAAFVCASVIMGALLVRAPTVVVVVWAVAAALLIAVAAWRVLPPEPVRDEPEADRDRFAGLGVLLRDRSFLIAILSVGAVQAAHAFYYAFSAILWKAQGLSEGVVGRLWAFSVVVEIAFMWWVEPWRRRLGVGPVAMLLLGSAAAIARWVLMALSPDPVALWPLQALHALSFAATYLAGVQLIERLAPRGSQTAAQTLMSVTSSGVLIGLATLASGPLHDQHGPAGYLAMAGLAAVGGALALALRGRVSDARGARDFVSSRTPPP